MPDVTYTFKDVTRCNMCGAAASSFRLLGRRLNRSQGLRPSRKTGITVSVVKCRNCGLIFSNPMPVPQSLQDHYGVPPENYWKEEYFTNTNDYFAAEIDRLRRLKHLSPGMRSLDIGAGLGKQMIALNRAGFDAYGIEGSEPFYERALSRMKVDPARLMLTTIEEASFPDEFFDFISFSAVLEHLYDPSLAIRKVLPWLRKDGLIHIEIPNARWLVGRLINWTYKVKMDDYVGNISPMHSPYHLYEFSIDSFVRNSVMSGYRILDYHYYVCDTFMPKVLNPLIRAYMKYTKTGMQLVVWLAKDGDELARKTTG